MLSHRCWQQAFSSLGPINRRFALILTSPQSNGWYHQRSSWASSSMRIEQFMTSCFNEDNNKKNRENDSRILEFGLPQHQLTRMMQLKSTSTMMTVMGAAPPLYQFRSFSTTTSRGEASPGETGGGDPNNPTFRQRLGARARKGAQRGQVMAKKGASTMSAMIRQYGPVFIGTYATIYFTTLGALFLGVDSGLLDPANLLHWLQGNPVEGSETPKSTVHMVVEILEHYSWTAPYAPVVEKNPHVANLAVSWIAIKFTEPIRLGVTLAIVPRLARYFGFVVKKEEEPVVEEEEEEEEIEDPAADKAASSKPLDQGTTVSSSTTPKAPVEKSAVGVGVREVSAQTKEDPVANDTEKAGKVQNASR